MSNDTKNYPNTCFEQFNIINFDEGILGFEMRKKGGEYRIGDHINFTPCVDIYKYTLSDTNERFLNHIIFGLYEFSFNVVKKYKHEYEGEYFYYCLIEIIPGLNFLHFSLTNDEYLKVGSFYHGFGRLTTSDNASLCNDYDDKELKNIHRKGILEKIQINRIWKDGIKYITLDPEHTDDTFSYSDILHCIGFPEEMIKFNGYISQYQDDQTSLESTGQNKDSDTLIYTIRMLDLL